MNAGCRPEHFPVRSACVAKDHNGLNATKERKQKRAPGALGRTTSKEDVFYSPGLNYVNQHGTIEVQKHLPEDKMGFEDACYVIRTLAFFHSFSVPQISSSTSSHFAALRDLNIKKRKEI